MATTALLNDLPTLLDLTKAMAPDGSELDTVDALSRNNELLQNLVFKQGNLPTGHVFGALNGLPPIAWRRFNEGVAAGKSKKDQITETCGMLSGISKVDKSLANLHGNAMAFRAGEDKAFVSAFKNELETGLFYHSTKATPEKFMGLSPRLDALSGIPYSSQVINATAGGTASGSDCTSIWAIVSGPDTVYGIIPKNMPGGLVSNDLDEQLTADEAGNEFVALVKTWDWRVGLAVQDARYVVRLANIDQTGLVKTGRLLIQDMIDMVSQLKDTTSGRPMIFCNRLMRRYLYHQAQNATASSMLSIEKDIENGKWVLMFMGIPIFMTDALLNTESALA